MRNMRWVLLAPTILACCATPHQGDNESQRHELIEPLVRFLKDWQPTKDSPQTVGTVILLLGELKANDAVPTLLDFLEFQSDPKFLEPRLRLHCFTPPAVTALIKIGKAAVPQTVHYLQGPAGDKPAVRVAVKWVLKGILGEKASIEFLSNTLRDCKSPQGRHRLEECLQDFDPKAFEAGRKNWEMHNAGRALPSGAEEVRNFWMLILVYAEDERNLAAFDESLKELKKLVGTNEWLPKWLEGRERVYEEIKKAPK